jgi:hypothetical protein
LDRVVLPDTGAARAGVTKTAGDERRHGEEFL